MSWKQFVAVANKVDVAINKQTSKQQEIMAVFHVLFLQMILYLFSNYDLARDALLVIFPYLYMRCFLYLALNIVILNFEKLQV